jgi:integrase
MPINKLSDRTVKAKTSPGRYGDGGGLYLQVSKWGTRAWIFRFERDGRERHMGLGPEHTLSLREARERARDCRRLLLDGIDPIEARKTKRAHSRAEAARAVLFKDCAEQYHAAHQAGWRSVKHARQWKATVEVYALPILGDIAVAAIDTALVVKCLQPIWQAKPQTAKRVRGRIESVLDFAAASGFRQGDNPARWRGHLDNILPSPTKVRVVQHRAALPYAEIPAFMAGLRERDGLVERALELAVLTAARSAEVLGATWGEFDLGARIWTIPPGRMKGAREHRVPLAERAVEILVGLPRRDTRIFQRNKNSMLDALRRMGRDDMTVHGFRSTFRDWAAETTAYPNHVVEMALAHAIGDQVEAAYRRGDLFEKRRRLMNDWAKYCERVPAAISNVTGIRSA